ncbi:GNAT family N-acetyltransferase [Micromonospora zhanjiangensis]|uniref:GNAT family N-acetyltransferase n=1 Tax=Micromonospora zhanjiangensis TaxID=1522057 RepID=A0ABV8KUP6_9ACTN
MQQLGTDVLNLPIDGEFTRVEVEILRSQDRTVQIGWTWMTPGHWRTGANTKAKFMLMRHAFEHQNTGRVAVKTDLRNERSQQATDLEWSG